MSEISERANDLIAEFGSTSQNCGDDRSSLQDDKDRDKARRELMQFIASLEAEVAELRARTRWIPVSSGNLPKISERVLVAMGNQWVAIGCWGSPMGVPERVWKNDSGHEIHNVTHWMPLPTPPEVQK